MVGRDVVVEGPLHVQNLGHILLGDGVRLRATPVISHLVTGPRGTLQVGHRTEIGHGASIASHHSIRIGEDVRIGAFVTLLDTDFHAAGDHAAAGETGTIEIGDGARLGPRVTVLRGSAIGAGAIVDAGSVVKGAVAAGARVSGNLARTAPVGDMRSVVGAIDVPAVAAVVAYTFGLHAAPAAETHRDEIAQWDSLGALNLLLSLEQAFEVSMRDDAMAQVRTVGDLVDMVMAAERTSA
jgi:acetyltransferase-like isoleucine patch superfamily enzyme/acyl carrier protein